MSTKNKLKRFSIETITTFYEVNVVFAENEEQAKKIVEMTDYCRSFVSKSLGHQIVNVCEAKDKDIERFTAMDPYFYDGASKLDEQGNLVHTNLKNEIDSNVPFDQRLS
jgi:hypothetical protein